MTYTERHLKEAARVLPRYHPAQQPNTALSDGWRETAL